MRSKTSSLIMVLCERRSSVEFRQKLQTRLQKLWHSMITRRTVLHINARLSRQSGGGSLTLATMSCSAEGRGGVIDIWVSSRRLWWNPSAPRTAGCENRALKQDRKEWRAVQACRYRRRAMRLMSSCQNSPPRNVYRRLFSKRSSLRHDLSQSKAAAVAIPLRTRVSRNRESSRISSIRSETSAGPLATRQLNRSRQ